MGGLGISQQGLFQLSTALQQFAEMPIQDAALIGGDGLLNGQLQLLLRIARLFQAQAEQCGDCLALKMGKLHIFGLGLFKALCILP